MTRRDWVWRAWVVLAGAVVVASSSSVLGGSPVEELAKRLPDGVVGFVATSGTAALEGDFAKTALGRIWHNPGVQSFYAAIKTELLGKIQQQVQDPNAGGMAEMAMQYARLILDRPLVVGATQRQAEKGPPIALFAIIAAGERRAELAAAVSKLEAMAGAGMVGDTEVGSLKMRTLKDEEDFPVCWGWAGNHLIIVANDVQGTIAQQAAAPRSTIPAYLGKVPAGDDALVVYYDYQRLGQLLSALARQGGEAAQAGMVAAVFKGLGLSDVRLLARVGFAGPDVVAHALFEMPSPAPGIFAGHRPIDPAWFAAVDIRAMTASAVNVDLAALYDTVMNLLKTVAPDEGYLAIRKGIVDFEADAKLRIREGLLASLAGPALFYSLPAGPLVEAPRGGFVAVAKLKDTPLFEKSLAALEAFVGAKAGQSLQIAARTRDDGRTVHVWSIPTLAMLNVMPAWSIAQDHVVVGSTVELCDLDVKQLVSKGADGKSLLDAEGYKKATADLPKDLISLSYTDSGVQLNQTMMQLQQFWPMVTMIAMQAQVKLPVMLPSLTDLAKDLGPAVSYRYFGPEGLHMCYRGPGLEASQGAIVGAAVGVGIALPAMAKARERARNQASMANLKQIGLALIMYTQDHDGAWPADLEQVKPYLKSSRVLESPHRPQGFEGPSYLYLSGQPKIIDPENVLAYENPVFRTDKINVLFADGHVESMMPEAFRRALQETCTRLGREMPGIRFKGETEVQPRGPRPPRPSKSTRI
jgi:prepilin-type processing-associated H-X9-DG protein